jgi:hypothetical protein
VFASALSTVAWAAAESAPEPKPVPLMQAIPLPESQVSFQRGGVELCRYHFAPNQHRPFVFPITGPGGRSLTRMGHPHDPESHSHHNSVWISHADVNGISFWDDRGKGRIEQRRVERFDDGPESASLVAVNAWMAGTNRVLLSERRLTTVHTLPDKEWLLIVDVELDAVPGDVTLGKTPFGLIGVRMAKTIGVHDGGGRIRNSEGGVNEAGCFWKPARWVDYSGPIASDAAAGITLFDHPANPNHPGVFHTRDDGWMGASLTHGAPLVLRPGRSLRLRYALFVHAGMPSVETIQRQWEAFAKMPLPSLASPPER